MLRLQEPGQTWAPEQEGFTRLLRRQDGQPVPVEHLPELGSCP